MQNKKGKIAIIHDDRKSHALWSVAKVEKVLLSNDNKIRGVTIKYFTNGKAVVINRPINKIYPIEPVKQTSVDIQPKFIDDMNICEIETTPDTLIRYTAVVYMYICIYVQDQLWREGGGCWVLHIVFAFPGTSVQASPRC